MLKLHHFDRSPYSWKVRIVLAEKSIPHELVVPQDKMNDMAFAKLNPYRLTPVLELGDGRTIYESTVICEYLEELHPEPAMLPKDPFERARIRMIEDGADQHLYAAIRQYTVANYEMVPPKLRRKPEGSVDTGSADQAMEKIVFQLELLDMHLENRIWFGGDMYSLADAALTPALCQSLLLHGILPDSRYSNIASWILRAKERSSWSAAAPKVPQSIE